MTTEQHPPGQHGDAVATAHRPVIMGTRHMVAAGHYLAALAAFEILEAGGNAVDAGVAGGLALGVLQSDIVNVAGVAPIIVYLADRREVLTLSGLGTWPKAASCALFHERCGGAIPEGLLRTVVPAAPVAWLLALERFGTMPFGEVAAAAIRFAGDGFPMHPLMAHVLATAAEDYRRWPSSAAVYLPGGRAPAVGEVFRQTDLARTLQFMADEERAASGAGRTAGLRAVRDAFYRGDIARAIVRYHAENDGLLTADDLAAFEVGIEPPVRLRFGATDVYTCGPWCQGPVLLQALSLLDGHQVAELGHNSTAYIHRVVEALKLAFADRERYYGDPRFVDVPLDGLLSPEYAAVRRALIAADRAWPGMPPAGEPEGAPRGSSGSAPEPAPGADGTTLPRDTSYVCVVDRAGNAFSATPSDTSQDTPVIPGTGLCPSSRGSQSWTDPSHPSCVAPGKRPRLTPNPALALRDGRPLPFGTPGGDVQAQAMLQVFLNIEVFGMDVQAAVEAPRFATFSFPDSFEPHAYHPGRITLEHRIGEPAARDLAALGHRVEWWPDYAWRAGAVCVIEDGRAAGVLSGGADPRRPAYAVGW